MDALMSKWLDYPMGPELRKFLGIDDTLYRGDSAPRPSDEALKEFSKDLIQVFYHKAPQQLETFVDLLEELTNMGLAQAAVELADRNSHFAIDGDFRACLSLGSALMMESELDEAILLLRQAQAIAPKELAPYINLATIYFALEQDEEALRWADLGLQLDVDQNKLWELVASIFIYADKSSAAEKIRQKAHELQSFAGLSLAAELIDPNDPLLKAQYLEDAFHAGARDDKFLVEYTAALGVAQQFEKIPQLIWRLENMEKKKISWKLWAHGVQAFLAMNQHEQALSLIDKASKSSDMPKQVIEKLKLLYDEEKSVTH